MFSEKGYYSFRAISEKNNEMHVTISDNYYIDNKGYYIACKRSYTNYLEGWGYSNIKITHSIYEGDNKDFYF